MTSETEMLTIRDFDYEGGDYEAAVRIHNALWPDNEETAQEWRFWDESRGPESMHERLIGEADGRVVACASYGESPWAHVPGKYFLDILVLQDSQRRGYGSAIFDHILECLDGRDPAPRVLTSWTREDKADSVRFLAKRGFAEGLRLEVSRLSLDSFDRERFSAYETRCEDLGLAVRTVADLSESDPDWKRKLYEFQWEITQDVPMDDPPTKLPFDTWQKKFASPTFLPEAWFMAVDGDRYVGMSTLWLCMGDRKKLWTGMTGVSRDYRRKGVATALKLRAIEYAKKRGVEFLETDNEESNPMYAINVRLGFEPQPAWREYRKTLTEDGEAGPPASG